MTILRFMYFLDEGEGLLAADFLFLPFDIVRKYRVSKNVCGVQTLNKYHGFPYGVLP